MANPIVDKSFQLALKTIDFAEKVRGEKQFELASQIFRSGTSIGANVRESQGSESKADFIHKLKIAFKESEELDYWFSLCEQSERLITPPLEAKELLIEVRKLLSRIISSAKRN